LNAKTFPGRQPGSLMKAKILAIKGTGGFHLACDALNTQAVNRLRTGKLREAKPFAVMFPNINTLSEFASLKPGRDHSADLHGDDPLFW
jgi:hydrogenase maturation factor HypF (carbamoyltransferase family)